MLFYLEANWTLREKILVISVCCLGSLIFIFKVWVSDLKILDKVLFLASVSLTITLLEYEKKHKPVIKLVLLVLFSITIYFYLFIFHLIQKTVDSIRESIFQLS